MTLLWIVLGTLAGGLLSLAVAGLLTFGLPTRWLPRMVGFSAGVLLSSALLDLLPEAFAAAREADIGAERLFACLLAGIVGFFFLQRIALWRHAHDEPGQHEPAEHAVRRAVPLILLGDAVHNCVDGVLIAAAFLTDPALGLSTTLAIVAHEIPQEAGDFVILRAAGLGLGRALWLNGLSSLGSLAGGLIGYLLLSHAQAALPYVITLAAASFLYIAVGDLLPLLSQGRDRITALWQSGFLAGGVALVASTVRLLH